VKTLKHKDFDALQGPAVVFVHAESWCHACKTMKPVVEKIEAETKGVQFFQVDTETDDGSDLADAEDIMSIPTTLLVKGGELVEAIVGLLSEAKFRKRVQALLKD